MMYSIALFLLVQASFAAHSFMFSGACDVALPSKQWLYLSDAECISSKNWPEDYGNDQQCEINILRDAVVRVGEAFDVEKGYDLLEFGRESEPINAYATIREVTEVPRVVQKGDTFLWYSDSSVPKMGWQLCFSPPMPPSVFFTFSGACDTAGNCVSSSRYPSSYGMNQQCEIVINHNAKVTPLEPFDIEAGYDLLQYGSESTPLADYKSLTDSTIPAKVKKGDRFEWSSDGSIAGKGWSLCFSDAEDSSEVKAHKEVALGKNERLRLANQALLQALQELSA